MTVETEEGELAESLGPPALTLAGSGLALHFLRLTWPGEARSRPADGRIGVSRNSAPIPDVDKSVRRLVAPSEARTLFNFGRQRNVSSRRFLAFLNQVKTQKLKLTA